MTNMSRFPIIIACRESDLFLSEFIFNCPIMMQFTLVRFRFFRKFRESSDFPRGFESVSSTAVLVTFCVSAIPI